MPRGLGCGPAMIADLVKGLHDGRPVIVAFEIFDCKPGSEAALIHFFSAVFFDMKFVDALAQNANPLFGPAEVDGIANVKMPHGGGTIQLIHKTRKRSVRWNCSGRPAEIRHMK